MKKKLKILSIFMVLTLAISYVSNTYARYVVDAASDIEMQFTKWQILINETDITTNTPSQLIISPILEENENIKANTFAPTSKGYFDILINPQNVELSFDYTISLELLNQNMPDILISNYSIINSSYIEGDTLTLNDITDNMITGSLLYDNKVENFQFESFTIRVYFEWYDGIDNQMDDTEDTNAAYNEENLQIRANINFQQKI